MFIHIKRRDLTELKDMFQSIADGDVDESRKSALKNEIEVGDWLVKVSKEIESLKKEENLFSNAIDSLVKKGDYDSFSFFNQESELNLVDHILELMEQIRDLLRQLDYDCKDDVFIDQASEISKIMNRVYDYTAKLGEVLSESQHKAEEIVRSIKKAEKTEEELLESVLDWMRS